MKTEQEIRDKIKDYRKRASDAEKNLRVHRKGLKAQAENLEYPLDLIEDTVEFIGKWTKAREEDRLIIEQLEWVLGQ